MKKFRSAKQALDFLNTKYFSLHKKYEDYFWLSYMGDHSVDAKMIEAESKRNAFRADPELRAECERLAKKSKGMEKDRLKTWIHFFGLFQTPPEALPIKKKVAEIESQIMQIRSARKEGYTDPKTGQFVPASENKMRVIMRTNPDETIRKACFDSLERLPLDSIDLFIEAVKGRNEYARLLGYTDFYDYKIHIDEGMTKEELFSMFDAIYEKTKYAFEDVRKMEEKMPGLRKPWNFGYMTSGDFTVEEDPYFQFKDVLSYWGRSFAALGIDFKNGSVTMDLLDRKGKWNNGFCHYPTLVAYKKGKRFPGSSNFASNAIPSQVGDGVHAIHTLFHEAGHAADRLNSMQEDACINTEYPPNTVSWAETQSMFLDTICSSIEWRMRYAKNSKGESYPFNLYERKIEKLHPLTPLGLNGMMMVSYMEKDIYESKDLTREKVIEIAKSTARKFLDRSEDSIWLLNVPHIYNWDSSAYYHGYSLAELCVHQWRDYFFDKYGYIVDNPKIGKELMKAWSYASKYPSKKLIKMATGKPLSADAFINDVTLSKSAILERAKNRIERLKSVPEFNGTIDLKGKISIVDGKNKVCDNKKGFENMDERFREWVSKA